MTTETLAHLQDCADAAQEKGISHVIVPTSEMRQLIAAYNDAIVAKERLKEQSMHLIDRLSPFWQDHVTKQ